MQKNTTEQNPDKNINRRQFINKAWKIAGFLALAEFTVVGLKSIKNTGFSIDKSTSNYIDAGALDDIKKGNLTSFRASRFFIYRANDGGLLAFSAACSHLGCAINWEPKQQVFICPCHSSKFDIKGNVLNSPAPRALDLHPLKIENGHVWVDTANKNQRNHYNKNQLIYA
jgi:Rieske Fe-S protein